MSVPDFPPPRPGDSSAGASLPGGEDTAERRDNAGRCNGIEEGQFPEIALGLGGLETRVGRQSSVRQPRLGKVVIVRHHQLLNSADLLVDEPAQLGGLFSELSS